MRLGIADYKWSCLALALALAIVLSWQQLAGILSPVQGSYNEGWNAYRQYATTVGFPLYGARPGYYVTNYTPLSFHIIGLISRVGWDVTLVGRVVSVISLLVICSLGGGITHLASRSLWVSIYAGLLFWISLAVFDPLQVGVNDPQLLGMAFMVAGYHQYLRNRNRLVSLALPAILFSTALMIKQSFVAVPFCVGLHLILNKKFADTCIFSCVGLVCCGLFLWVFSVLDGPYLLANWFFDRAASWEAAIEKTTTFVLNVQIPLVVALWTIMLRFSRNWVVQSLGISLVGCLAMGAVFVAGDGVNQNLFIDALFIICVLAATQLGMIALDAHRPETFGIARPTLAVLLLLPAIFAAPNIIVDSRKAIREAAVVAKDHATALTIIREQPGPALCEHIKLCYDAGKPMSYDPFFVSDQLQIKALSEDSIIELIDRQCYGSVELEMWRDETAILPTARPRFTENLVTHLFRNYDVVYESHGVANGIAVFLPTRRATAAAGASCRPLPELPARS